MGLESDLRKRRRVGALQKAVLTSLSVTGLVLVAVAAPNLLSLIGRAQGRLGKSRLKSTLAQLIDKGMVTFVERDGNRFLTITPLGQRYADAKFVAPKRGRWDGRWRMVIFDIPQQRTAYRNLLRHKLVDIGFERLQNSVWVYPYDCEELILLLKADFGLGKEVLYIIADSIENDRALRGRFGLKAQ